MTTYINTETLEYPLYEGDIRAAFRHAISFPASGDFEAPSGFAPVVPATSPDVTADQVLVQGAPVQVEGVWTQQWSVAAIDPAAALAHRQAMASSIDAACAAITGRFLPFMREYEAREAQAQAYKDAGYTGTVPVRVAEFATPAGMPASMATDLILSQAANLRAAEAALSGLRMRKYEVLGAASVEVAKASHAAIMAAIDAVGATI